jgi:phage FluMu protein Com
MIDDKVKIRCPGCKLVFREKASRVRDGFQVNCSHCNKLITMSKETEDSFMRRALKTAKDIRAAKEAELVAKVYTGAASAPPRETP